MRVSTMRNAVMISTSTSNLILKLRWREECSTFTNFAVILSCLIVSLSLCYFICIWNFTTFPFIHSPRVSLLTNSSGFPLSENDYLYVCVREREKDRQTMFTSLWVHTCTVAYPHVCIFIWKPEVDTGCLPPLFSIVFIEARTLTEPETRQIS